ncbi:MAG: hypothetical protein U0470_10690 [Anaerolineae bacterium]
MRRGPFPPGAAAIAALRLDLRSAGAANRLELPVRGLDPAESR